MEMLNPSALLQQGQPAGRDMSLPGAGWGLLQGYHDAVARNQAQDFLGAAAMQQGMGMADQLQRNYRFAEETPLHLQGMNLTNQATQANTEGQQVLTQMNRQKLGASEEESRTERIAFMAHHAPVLKNLASQKGGLAAQEYLDKLKGIYKYKFGVDVDPMFNQYSPQTQQVFDQALSVYDYDIKHRQELFKQQQKLDTAKDMQTQELDRKDKWNKEDNETKIEVARIAAEAQKATNRASVSGHDSKYIAAKAKELEFGEKALTPEERAYSQYWPDLRAQSPYIKADAKATGNVQQLRDTLKEIEKMGEGQKDPEDPKSKRIVFDSQNPEKLPMGDKAKPGMEAIDQDGNVYRYGTMNGQRGWHLIPGDD